MELLVKEPAGLSGARKVPECVAPGVAVQDPSLIPTSLLACLSGLIGLTHWLFDLSFYLPGSQWSSDAHSLVARSSSRSLVTKPYDMGSLSRGCRASVKLFAEI